MQNIVIIYQNNSILQNEKHVPENLSFHFVCMVQVLIKWWCIYKLPSAYQIMCFDEILSIYVRYHNIQIIKRVLHDERW